MAWVAREGLPKVILELDLMNAKSSVVKNQERHIRAEISCAKVLRQGRL